MRRIFQKQNLISFFTIGFVFALSQIVFADLYVNILAVNATEESKEKEVREYLPKELTADDILDTAGLKLDYDITKSAYLVHGKVTLAPKETKTFKIRIRDVWKFGADEVKEIKEQIDITIDRMKDSEFDSEYYETAKLRKENLVRRLEFIVSQQERYADNVEKRIDQYRNYSDEYNDIRGNSVSVTYWRSDPRKDKDKKIFRYIVAVENTSQEKEKEVEPKHYLPPEVMLEHLVELQGFDLKYDVEKGQSYLTKKEVLQPGESKRYDISIVDIWNIDPVDIEELKDRTRKTFALLERTVYEESGGYLVKNIKKNLERIEKSQAKEKNINEHISAYRANKKHFRAAEDDVQALEDLLEAVREHLERSQLKNVLQKVKKLKSIADVSDAIFGTKPAVNNAWKIITGIVIFVGIYTLFHFALWGKRSKSAKLEDVDTQNKEEQ